MIRVNGKFTSRAEQRIVIVLPATYIHKELKVQAVCYSGSGITAFCRNCKEIASQSIREGVIFSEKSFGIAPKMLVPFLDRETDIVRSCFTQNMSGVRNDVFDCNTIQGRKFVPVSQIDSRLATTDNEELLFCQVGEKSVQDYEKPQSQGRSRHIF